MQSLIPKDKQEALEQDIEKHKDLVKSIVITDEETAKGASELLSIIKRKGKRLKEMRLEYTKPLRDQVSEANNFFKVYEEGFEDMEKSLKSVVGEWLREVERKAREDQAKREQEELKRIEEAKASGDNTDESTEITPVSEAPKGNIRTGSGLVSTQKRWTFEIVDPSKVPDKYKVVDSVSIRNAIRLAHKDDDKINLEIPGIKIYQDINVSVR